MKSVARPQQWSELPGQEQSLLHPISLILPGKAATTFLAALTETALQAPTAGILGAEYPPKPVAAEEQHFICAGPGHWLLTEVPAQSDCQRQFPEEHFGLEQHLMLAASAGQAPEMEVPPAVLQAASVIQTPAMPLGP